MKFGHLIEYNMRNIFLEKSYTKCGGETCRLSSNSRLFRDSFLKNHNGAYLRINSLRFSTVYLYCMLSWGRYQKILKLSSRPLAFTAYIAFLKNKKRSGTSLPASFSAWFLRKSISLITFYYLLYKFFYIVAFTSWDIAQYVHGNCLLTRLRHEFQN